MTAKLIKVFKDEFDYQNRSFNNLYKRLSKENMVLILKKYKDFNVLYDNWVKTRKLLLNKIEKDKNCYLFDKNRLQAFLESSKKIYKAHKDALQIDGVPDFFESIPDGKGLKYVVNIVGFASDYIYYLQQCLNGKANTKPTETEIMKW